MSDAQNLKMRYRTQLSKALKHLKYSQHKIAHLPSKLDQLNEEQLESWEGLVARFSRVTDIFLNKFLRSIILEEEGAFRGTLRDLLNWSVKHAIINDVERWMAIRELRNRAAHEYLEERLEDLFAAIRFESEFVVNELELLLKG